MPEESIDIRAYLQAILRRWWLLVLGPVLGGLVPWVLTSGFLLQPAQSQPPASPPVYEASTIIAMGSTGLLGAESELVSSRPVLEGAINALGLEASTDALRPAVSTSRLNGSTLVELKVRDPDPDRAVAMADAVAQSLINYIAAYHESRITEVEEYLQSRLSANGTDSFQLIALVRAASLLDNSLQAPIVIAPAEVVGVSREATGSANNEYLNVIVGGILGGLISVGLVTGLEIFQGPVRSQAQVERALGLECLGMLPKQRDRNSTSLLFAKHENNAAEVESLRQMAANLTLAAGRSGVEIVAVVSPTPRDGRSRLVANLGVALAEIWEEVLLVDADFRSPTLHRYFEADNSNGLSGYLESADLDVDAAVQETPFQRLRIIPSGPVPENPVEMLSNPRMQQLLDHAKESFDIVLVDTPPLLAVTDGVLLSSKVEGAIILINSATSAINSLRGAWESWKRSNTPVLGYVWVGNRSLF